MARKKNAALSDAHKALQAQFKSSAENERLKADHAGAVAEMPGTHKDNRARLREQSEYHSAQSQRFFQAATRTAFLTDEQVAPLAIKLRRATPKQVAELASTVLDLYRRRLDAQEADAKVKEQRAAAALRAVSRGEQGSLFAPTAYRVEVLGGGTQGDLFSPAPLSVPASAIGSRVKLAAKDAERFAKPGAYRTQVLDELSATVGATGQAVAVEGPRGQVLAVVRLTQANGRKRSARACKCSNPNARALRGPRTRRNGPRSLALALSADESARFARSKSYRAEVFAQARATVRESGGPVLVLNSEGVTLAVARPSR